MSHSKIDLSTSAHGGRIVLASMMFIFVLVILVVFLSFSDRASAFSRYDKIEAPLAALSSLKAMIIKPKVKVGVMNGIVYNPPYSTAVIDQLMVHEGDRIHDVVVTAIHDDAVDFAKDGITWQQSVRSRPNAAWTAQAKDNK